MKVALLALIGPIGLPELVIIFFILILIFGAKRLSARRAFDKLPGFKTKWVMKRPTTRPGLSDANLPRIRCTTSRAAPARQTTPVRRARRR